MRLRLVLAVVSMMVAAPALAGTAAGSPPGPVITRGGLDNGGRPCATSTDAPIRLGYLSSHLEAIGQDGALMPEGSYTFEIWAVGDHAAATVMRASSYVANRTAAATVPDGVLLTGHRYAWHARFTDSNGRSGWSPTCFFNVDLAAPQDPGITSTNFPLPWTPGPVGVLADFVISSRGDRGIAGFQYGWVADLGVTACENSGPQGQLVCPDPLAGPDIVPVGTPGGVASLSLPPPDAGPQTLSVRAIDRAGNISSVVSYHLFVPGSDPSVTPLDTAPICGDTVRFRLAPNPAVTRVTSYTYVLNFGRQFTVPANSYGKATAAVAVNPGVFFMRTTSLSADGFVSSSYTTSLTIHPKAGVSASIYTADGQPHGGVGQTDTFVFGSPPNVPSVGSYDYTFSDGVTGTVSADSDASGSVEWTPSRSGAVTVTVTAHGPDRATVSCPVTYSYVVA